MGSIREDNEDECRDFYLGGLHWPLSLSLAWVLNLPEFRERRYSLADTNSKLLGEGEVVVSTCYICRALGLLLTVTCMLAIYKSAFGFICKVGFHKSSLHLLFLSPGPTLVHLFLLILINIQWFQITTISLWHCHFIVTTLRVV